MTRAKRPKEAVSGSYTPIPHAVLDSRAFTRLSNRAKALLFELLRQHNGKNNGRFQLTGKWLKGRGWTSADQVQKGKAELLESGLLFKTKYGGLTTGPDWFAVTWLPISDFTSLDVSRSTYPQGAWALANPLPENRESSSAARSRTTPQHGVAVPVTAPQHGAIRPQNETATTPPHGNNECCQLPRSKNHSRVVGKPRRSGRRLAESTSSEGAQRHD